jgi:hypothetical protein
MPGIWRQSTYVVRLLGDRFQFLIRDDRLLSPNAPLGRLVPEESRSRGKGGAESRSSCDGSEGPSRNDLNSRKGSS